MIQVDHLRKLYGDLAAVDDISFEARAGEIFGLLGPNGAGKSTTIGCLSGLLTPSSGHVKILGHDITTEPAAAKAALGIVPQDLALYEDVSAEENLSYWGGAYGLSGNELRVRIKEVLELAGLSDRAREAVKKYSGGMKRRLNLACGLVHRPKVLLLDEPTVGVDPQSRVRLLDLVKEEAARGTCVLYTTHYMEEAQALCDRIGIIDHGKIIALGTLEELKKATQEKDLVRLSGTFPAELPAGFLESVDHAAILAADTAMVTVAVPGAAKKLPALLAALEVAGADVQETTVTQPSLETLFIKLTGKELRE